MEKNEMNELYEDVFRKVGNLTAKSQVLQAVVNVAMDKMRLDGSKDYFPIMEDSGAAVLLLISAFFPEEYDFRKAQLEREKETEKNSSVIADHIKRHIDNAIKTQEGE